MIYYIYLLLCFLSKFMVVYHCKVCDLLLKIMLQKKKLKNNFFSFYTLFCFAWEKLVLATDIQECLPEILLSLDKTAHD